MGERDWQLKHQVRCQAVVESSLNYRDDIKDILPCPTGPTERCSVLPPQTARDLALGFMGRLGRLPGGRLIIAFMGHMRPDPRLRFTSGEPKGPQTLTPSSPLTMPSRVGLGCGFDMRANATAAFTQFGFGFLEVGPVARSAVNPTLQRTDDPQSLVYAGQPAMSVDQARRWLKSAPHGAQSLVFVRLADHQHKHARELAQALGEQADGIVAPADWPHETLAELSDQLGPLYLVVPANATAAKLRQWVDCHRKISDGWIVGPASREDRWELGRRDYEQALNVTKQLRELLGEGVEDAEGIESATICQSVGIHNAEHALESLAAGADLVQVSSGLAFSGPGLPKRINDAILHQLLNARKQADGAGDPGELPNTEVRERASQQAWFWALLMGAAMFFGGMLAMAIASTRVVLPYDEAMSGLTRAQLAELNPRLLDFMTHDRVTLAGTMLCVGLIYMILAWWGIKRGVHWAARATVFSAMAGFFSFFSFLGFGYFDPFHAFVTAVLFQLLLMVMHSDLPLRDEPEAPELTDSPRWRLSQWGQLLFVIHGAVLIVAGLVITKVGMTEVFVKEDLEFMQTDIDCFADYPSLIPLVAHDRATFGGMLISCGMAVLLTALWGFRRGQAWVWWALTLAGSAAYLSTIAVHWIVGYDSLVHLLPAYGGLALLWLGGVLSYPHLVMNDAPLEARWRRYQPQ